MASTQDNRVRIPVGAPNPKPLGSGRRGGCDRTLKLGQITVLMTRPAVGLYYNKIFFAFSICFVADLSAAIMLINHRVNDGLSIDSVSWIRYASLQSLCTIVLVHAIIQYPVSWRASFITKCINIAVYLIGVLAFDHFNLLPPNYVYGKGIAVCHKEGGIDLQGHTNVWPGPTGPGLTLVLIVRPE